MTGNELLPSAQVLVVMGVAGAGKTTIGRLLAARLSWRFLDADDFHPSANILKMTHGEPLTDADRLPWLTAMHDALVEASVNSQSTVLAASMLKDTYRKALISGLDNIHFVYLSATPELIARRLARRSDHFMKADMLASQFAALEEPEDALIVDAGQSQPDIVEGIVRGLALV